MRKWGQDLEVIGSVMLSQRMEGEVWMAENWKGCEVGLRCQDRKAWSQGEGGKC